MSALRIRRLRLVALGVLGAGVAFSLAAAAKLSKTGEATAAFRAFGPVGMNIDGSTHELDVADDGATVRVVVPLANLKTGISLRDKHMRNSLAVESYPTAQLQVDRAQLSFPKAVGDESTGQAKGKMTLHGQTHDVTIEYRAKRSVEGYSVNGSTHVNMTSYGIVVPSYLGVTVKPDVDVTVQFSAKDG
jgi:polyisoprenoid-binding protein YceI